MKKLVFVLLAGVVIFSVSCKGGKNKEDAEEENWITLFDGTSTTGWRGVSKTGLPAAWVIDNGTLHCIGSGKGETNADNGGDILYDKKFSNFHLKFDWKISEGGNSGVMYLGQEIPEWRISMTAPEYQLLDNTKNQEALLGKDGNRQSGSLYDLIPAKPQNTKPAGEWNSAEIMVYKGTVIHRLNGQTVLSYQLWTDDWKKLVESSKFPDLNPYWTDVAQEGYIALQDNGDDVWLRNIKIVELQ